MRTQLGKVLETQGRSAQTLSHACPKVPKQRTGGRQDGERPLEMQDRKGRGWVGAGRPRPALRCGAAETAARSGSMSGLTGAES